MHTHTHTHICHKHTLSHVHHTVLRNMAIIPQEGVYMHLPAQIGGLIRDTILELLEIASYSDYFLGGVFRL